MPEIAPTDSAKEGAAEGPAGGGKALAFLKWPGGKTWLAHRLAACIAEQLRGVYYEPFLGSGAAFFSLQPSHAVLSDVNGDLINSYLQVRNDHAELLQQLQALPVSSDVYYRLREEEPSDPVDRVVRFLYLNRTAFGGIYRLNREGKFNVPYGGGERGIDILWQKNLLERASAALRGDVELFSRDFEISLRLAKPGDVVYCDPTYTVSHEDNAFRRYNERNFSWVDQVRLADAASAAVERGVSVIVTNACHKCIRDLYAPNRPLILDRISRVSRKNEGRRPVREYIFALGPWPRLWRRHFRRGK